MNTLGDLASLLWGLMQRKICGVVLMEGEEDGDRREVVVVKATGV